MRSVTVSILCLLLICTLVQAEAPPIQQWIDEAIQAGGGVVTIPEGEHVLEKGLVIKNAKNLAIRGVDKERCILKLASWPETKDMVYLIEVSGSCETLEIANLTLDGKPSSKPSGKFLGINLIHVDGMSAPSGSGIKDIHIRDCMLQHFNGSGVLVHNTEGCVVERCSFLDGGFAVSFYYRSKDCIARGNQIIRVPTLFHMYDASNCLIIGNESWDHAAIWIQSDHHDDKQERHVIRNNAFHTKALLSLLSGENTPQPLTEDNEGLVPYPKN
jgi:hypothetical protein